MGNSHFHRGKVTGKALSRFYKPSRVRTVNYFQSYSNIFLEFHITLRIKTQINWEENHLKLRIACSEDSVLIWKVAF